MRTFFYPPKVSPGVFIFVADHEIVAPNRKPGYLGTF